MFLIVLSPLPSLLPLAPVRESKQEKGGKGGERTNDRTDLTTPARIYEISEKKHALFSNYLVERIAYLSVYRN